MRTRFLGLDFFNSSAPIETLDDFLRFPVTEIPPPPPSISISGDKNLFDCFDTYDQSILNLSSQLQSVQIDTALSKFLDDVLPHYIEVDQCCFYRDRCDEKKTKVFTEEVDIEKQINAEPNTLEEESGTAVDGNGDNIFELLMFEKPELDMSLGNVCTAQEQELKIFSEVSDVETSEDLLIPMLKMQDLCKIQESLFAVENISVEYQMDQSNSLLEDSGSFKGQNYPCYAEFPLLEVDVSSLGIFSSISVDNEINIFESIEPQFWCAKDETLFDGKELLQFMKLDILEYLSCNSLSNQRLETDIVCSNFIEEIDLFSVIEHEVVVEKTEIYLGRPENTYFCSRTPILFEELQFFNLLSFQFSKFFSEIEALSEVETIQQLFCEASNVNNFNDLIVSHELALVDDSFKSLPVPMLSYSEENCSIQEYLEEILAELNPLPSLASDAIYLDWHIIEEGKCNSSRYSSCLKVLEEVDGCANDLNMKSFDAGVLVLDSILFDDNQYVSYTKEGKEMLKIPSINTSVAHVCQEETSSRPLNDGCQKRVKGESPCNLGSDSVSRLIKSMSECNNLDFFLNPSKTTVRKNPCTSKAVATNTTVPGGSASDSIAASEQWNIEMHQIRLSDNILVLLEDLSKTYLGILDSDISLGKRKYSCLSADDYTLLTISNKKLMEWMKEMGTGKSLGNNDDNMVPLITLYAIKQMAWYLCYYGIHTTFLYIDNLHQKLKCSKYRLSFLRGLVLDAHEKVKTEIIRCHPSLSVIHGILKSRFRKNYKILIVAERVFWWPLKMLLNSMEISSINAQSFKTHTNELGTCYDIPSGDTIMEAVVHSDSCLISLEHISSSFPFGKFNIILEYGGSYGSSRLSTISPEVGGFPVLHFLKMDLENSSAAKSLCENVDTPSHGGIIRDGDPQCGQIIGENNQKLEELLNFVPANEYNMGSPRAANCFKPLSIPPSLPCPQLDIKTTQVFPSMSSFPDAIVVVNTQSVDNEMIISRRSTYQKILAMEKKGTQVVERDLHHPVDVIVNAAVCLVWYDCRNIRKKATASNEASSSLPLCIENIAANGLTALSFAFSGCILVFEGQNSFLGGVMESSDELYAAAASLGMDLQLFFSYSSEMTDEIILNCIIYASKFTKGLYPTMPESETLAESFLTTFPSLNPLSAHAILSSVGVLIEFLESSHKDRVRAVQKYQVSDESIALLNACFRYGEREDCKSGTTECSSSVSSAPDSDNCPTKSASEMRKRKYIQSTLNVDLPVDDLFHLDTSKLFSEARETPKRMSKPDDTWLSELPDVFSEARKSSLSFENELFAQNPGSNINSKETPSRMSKLCGSYMSKSRVMSEERDNNVLPGVDDALFCQNQRLESGTTNKFDRWSSMNSENFIQNFIGEVINIDDKHPGVEESSATIFPGLSYFKSDMERDSPQLFSKTARKLSFDNNSLPNFPRAAEIDYDTDGFVSRSSDRQSLGGQQYLKEQVFQNVDKEMNIEETMLSDPQKYLLKEDTVPKSVGSSYKYSLMENNMPRYGGTPLSNAIQFAQPHQGSPWTIEFLNRVREKSKLRQKSLPHDLSGPSSGYKGNISKVTKRRSPSILEFFKYQKGSKPSKRTEQKRPKRSSQPTSSYKNEKTLPSFLPEMTPIDKRARQSLSFATPGSSGQSKLVWGDMSNTHALKRQFQLHK